MATVKILDTAHSYRYLSPPFTLREMFGQPYLQDREIYSVKEWLRFGWVKPQPAEYIYRMFLHLAHEQSLGDQPIKDAWQAALKLATEVFTKVESMSNAERFLYRAKVTEALDLEPSDMTFPSGQLGLFPGISVPPISVGGTLKVPDLPKIPGIDISDVIPPLQPEKLLETVKDKITGITVGVFESIKGLIGTIAHEVLYVLNKFVDRMGNVISLFKDGILDQAFGELFHALVYFATDALLSSVAVAVNWTYDIIAATFFSVFFGRPMTRRERDFAHSIFGGQINVTNVRIVNHLGWDRGIVAANVIYMPSLDLDEPSTARTFAHELTHIYQDQHVDEMPATGTATREQLGHMFSTHGSPYRYELDNRTTWWDLRVEGQAQLVGDYKVHVVDQSKTIDALSDPTDVAHAERIFQSMRLFRWR